MRISKHTIVRILLALLCRQTKTRLRALIALSLCSIFYVNIASAQSDLLDSPLSLSLSKTVQFQSADSSSVLVLNQSGLHNTTTIKQTANASNHVDINQVGDNNIAHLVQDGFNNEVNLLQLGNDNLVDVIQQGDANIANIQQFGGQAFIVHQIGNEMVVNITQYKQ